MKCHRSWAATVLAALLQLQGAYSLKRSQPEQDAIRQLRATVDSKDEELTQQKNIAHGLELEVRELQSELQAEKKALSAETQKEQTLQQKLDRVRAVVDDSPNAAPPGKRSDKGVAAPVDRSAPSTPALAAPADVNLNSPVTQEAAEVPEIELDAPEAEAPAQQAVSKPAATRQATPPAPAEESPAAMKARQIAPQEPPPFFEAAAIQSSSVVAPVPAKHVASVPKAASAKVRATKRVQEKPVHATAPPAAQHLRGADTAVKAAPAPTKAPATPDVLVKLAKMAPALPASSLKEVESKDADITPVKDSDKGATSDFDALEAQLHEEDRRIQDLDRENALDSMSDGSSPPATPSAQQKSAPGKPAAKLDLDGEASPEGTSDADFLNVESPAADAGKDEAIPAKNSSDDAFPELALPQVGSNLDGALSDNQFLTQIAPAPKH